MKIAVDAMGGDHAPDAVVAGTLLARSLCPADLVLIGDEQRIGEALGDGPGGSAIEVIHAPEAIGMGEAGPLAIRKKHDASLNVAMRMLAEGRADAVLSAGNTAAIVASAKHYVGLFSWLRRPALAVAFPARDGGPLLLDAGAHAQAGAVHLAQSAALAHIYLKVSRRLERPRISLLNIGQEPAKGTRAVQRAFALMKRSGLNFVGNVEPNDLFSGRVDAVVCEGFVGNIVLKMFEGLSEGLIRALGKRVEEEDPLIRGQFSRIYEGVQRSYHYRHVGGAPLLGVNKPVVVAHGRSEGTAICNAILLAFRMASDGICEKMSEESERDGALTEFKSFNAMLIVENLKKKWGFSPK